MFDSSKASRASNRDKDELKEFQKASNIYLHMMSSYIPNNNTLLALCGKSFSNISCFKSFPTPQIFPFCTSFFRNMTLQVVVQTIAESSSTVAVNVIPDQHYTFLLQFNQKQIK